MNNLMHEKITVAGLKFSGKFNQADAEYMIETSNYPDIFWGLTANDQQKDSIDLEWRKYILAPEGNVHQLMDPLRLRETFPSLIKFWIDAAMKALTENNSREAAGMFGCLSHLIGDTAQAAHLMDERIISDLFPQKNTCYMTHGTIERINGEIPDIPYTPRLLGGCAAELEWRLLEELAILQQKEKAELPMIFMALENRDMTAAEESAGRSATHAAELLADAIHTAMLIDTGISPEKLSDIDLRLLLPCDQFCDSYFNFRIMIDQIPGTDIYQPLPLELSEGATPGIAMLPYLAPSFKGVREAYAEYLIPAGIFAEFTAKVGLNRVARNETPAVFEVWLDDVKAYESTPCDIQSPPLRISLPLGNASRIKLRVIDPRPDARQTKFIYPVWLNPILKRKI